MSPPDLAEIGDRAPRPDPRVNSLAMVAAAAVAALAYVLGLSTSRLPSPGFAVVLVAAAPILAAVALAVLRSRAEAEDDDGLRWFAAGLAGALPAMVLQLISFPLVADGGGVVSTSGTGSAALYLQFHLALALGAGAAVLRVAERWRSPAVIGSSLLAVALAADAVPLPVLLNADGTYPPIFVASEFLLAAFTATCAAGWLLRSGRAARPLHTAVSVALSLAAYDLVLNAISARRFDPVWWSSLSLRVATFAVLAVVGVAAVLRQLLRWERYTETELGRREDQLRASLARTQDLLASVTSTAHALQRTLLPSELVAVPGASLAARHRAAPGDVWTTWYDTIPLPSGAVALVVGAVDARDLSGATVVGLVRGALRSYALEGHPPSVVLERADALLRAAGAPELVDVAYTELYPEDRIVTVAIAGGAAAGCLDPGGPVPALLPVRRGPALGEGLASRRDESTLLLPPGALLALTTAPTVVTSAPGPHESARTASSAGLTPDHVADTLAAAVPPARPLALLVARTAAGHRPAVERTLPVHRLSAGVARTWLADVVEAWQQSGRLPEADPDTSSVAQLLLTELVSNAVRHSDLVVGVRVALVGTRLRVEVSDSSHRMPMLRPASREDTSGRGLFLVERLSAAWGMEMREQGKAVWFELELEAADEPAETDEDALLAAFADPQDSDLGSRSH